MLALGYQFADVAFFRFSFVLDPCVLLWHIIKFKCRQGYICEVRLSFYIKKAKPVKKIKVFWG